MSKTIICIGKFTDEMKQSLKNEFLPTEADFFYFEGTSEFVKNGVFFNPNNMGAIDCIIGTEFSENDDPDKNTSNVARIIKHIAKTPTMNPNLILGLLTTEAQMALWVPEIRSLKNCVIHPRIEEILPEIHKRLSSLG